MSTGSTLPSKVIAYLDILGFSNYCNKNIQNGISLIYDYQEIINTKITDQQLHPSASYPNNLRNLAEQYEIDSFEYFLPFSDSIFILSSNPDKFLQQVSNFLIDSFLFRANKFITPEDPTDPTSVTTTSYSVENGKLVSNKQKECWPPLFFRGGISFGEAYPFTINAIFNSKIAPIENMTGSALIKAVGEEKLAKGPRLFCDIDFYDQLNSNSKLYCKQIDKSHFELLWPAFYFIKNNGQQEIAKIYDFILPAATLWKAYNHEQFGIHYFEFLRLIVTSTKMFFPAISNDELLEYLRKAGIEDKESVLLK